jgi:hypothetical protein
MANALEQSAAGEAVTQILPRKSLSCCGMDMEQAGVYPLHLALLFHSVSPHPCGGFEPRCLVRARNTLV